MKLEKAEMNRNLEDSIRKAVVLSLGQRVLLEDEHKGVLFGKIVESDELNRYKISCQQGEVVLCYHDLLDLYVVKKDDGSRY